MASIERIQKWHDALLSGEYAQTTGVLRDYYGFCCLGVACDISGLKEWSRPNGESYYYDYNRSLLPNSVQKWLGIEETNEETVITELIGSNDRGGDFKMIAAMIREFWPEVKLNG